MTITSDEIKKALAPFTEITNPVEPVSLDIEKVASTLIAETGKFANADDPMSQLDALTATVDKIDVMLKSASEDENGRVTVSGDTVATEYAKSFGQPAAAETEKASPAPKVIEDATGTPAVEDTDKAAENEKGNEDKTKKSDDETDLSDDIKWDNDLAPSVGPTGKARLTKGERVVRATKGARSSTEKAATARENALARRASGGPRSLA